MYEVKVYDKDDIVITAEVFNTLEESFKFFDRYALDYYTEINRLEDDSQYELSDLLEDSLSDLPEYNELLDLSEYKDLILAITDDATFLDI